MIYRCWEQNSSQRHKKFGSFRDIFSYLYFLYLLLLAKKCTRPSFFSIIYLYTLMSYKQDHQSSPKNLHHPRKREATSINEQKLFYDCQCGKRYDAFPGLYLHFKRKHDLKISSHPPPKTFDIHKTSFCTVITYFFSRGQAASPQNVIQSSEDFYSKMKLIIEECIKTYNTEKKNQKLSTMVLDKFGLYLVGEERNQQGREQNQFLENLPYRFNSFFMEEVRKGSVTDRNCEEWRDTLVKLSEWLNKKGYSQLITLKNQQFILLRE